MNIQGIMAQAQKMQRELKKAMDEFEKEEFKVEKNGAVTVTMLGNLQIVSIVIDEEFLDKDNKDMVEETVKLAVNEIIETISNARDEIQERITGRAGGLGF